nr:hypothetical protein [Tanacetum cinerariifolium]
MFYRENVNYPALIWEDLAYQIDHRKDKRARCKNMPFLDSPRLKFIRIGEDYQEYGLLIPETMLTEAIKQYESNLMFIKYSTGQISPKKSKGKGSQSKKIFDDSQETVDVSKKSEPKPESTKRKTASRRVVQKKVTKFVANNIILDIDVALELDKSISITKAEEEEEAAKQVHATHARIVTESGKKKTSRSSKSKLKGVSSLTPEEQQAADIIQALKESKKTSKRHPGTRGSSEGIGTKLGVLDESTVVYATSSKGTDKLDYEENDDKEGDVDDEDDETKSDEDGIYKYKIRVRKDGDEEMINAEVDDSVKGDEEVTDAAKADAKKTSEAKDDAKKTELLLIRSSLSVSSGFGDQFLKLSSDSSLVSTVKDTTYAKINSMLEVKIQSKVPHTQEALIDEENAMYKGVADTGNKTKRRRTKESESSKKPSSTKETLTGKALSKGYKTGKSASAKEPVKEPIAEVVMDDAGDYVVHDDDHPQDAFEPKTAKTSNQEWFKQPLRPLTPDSKWNKRHRTVAVDYFFNNDLQYLKTSDLEKILGVKSVSVKKLLGYGRLEEIVVKRVDQYLILLGIQQGDGKEKVDGY